MSSTMISGVVLALFSTVAVALPQGTATGAVPSSGPTPTSNTTSPSAGGGVAAAAASSQPVSSGMLKLMIETNLHQTHVSDPGLTGHTIFRPVDMSGYEKLPVVVWGNGACSADVNQHLNFLMEVAAWGNIVIASGEPGSSGGTTAEMMTQSIDWAVANAGQGDYAKMDASKIAAAGMSCGGTEAYAQAGDERVSAIGIFNSGNLSPEGTQQIVGSLQKPIFFFLGGPSDIAYQNGMRDFEAVPSGVATWVGNVPVGHGGTYSEPNGGVFGTAAQHFFRWVLQGDASAADYFTGSGAQADGWETDSRSLETISA